MEFLVLLDCRGAAEVESAARFTAVLDGVEFLTVRRAIVIEITPEGMLLRQTRQSVNQLMIKRVPRRANIYCTSLSWFSPFAQ